MQTSKCHHQLFWNFAYAAQIIRALFVRKIAARSTNSVNPVEKRSKHQQNQLSEHTEPSSTRSHYPFRIRQFHLYFSSLFISWTSHTENDLHFMFGANNACTQPSLSSVDYFLILFFSISVFLHILFFSVSRTFACVQTCKRDLCDFFIFFNDQNRLLFFSFSIWWIRIARIEKKKIWSQNEKRRSKRE